MKKIFTLIAAIALSLIYTAVKSQLPHNLKTGWDGPYCQNCRKQIDERPREVLFGIHIDSKGDVYFSMNNEIWFDKIFRNNSFGVCADIVAKDKYRCGVASGAHGDLPKGTMLAPVYRPELLKNSVFLSSDNIYTKIGTLPKELMNKELEGNLVIVNGPYICFYTNFVDIPRSSWNLLPMGLFTDSLLNSNTETGTGSPDAFFTYSNSLQLEIPFQKASAGFNEKYLSVFFDSVKTGKYKIRKIEARVYSSVEGSEAINKRLMKARADSIFSVAKKYYPNLSNFKTITAENWVDFYSDVENTDFEAFRDMPKETVKQKLLDKAILEKAEPILSKHRKAILQVFLDSKTSAGSIPATSLVTEFNNAVQKKDVNTARQIQKELVDRILDNEIPYTYLDQLEIPREKEFMELSGDREAYRYYLKISSEYEALRNFQELRKLDSLNGKINYNIAALKFFIWKNEPDSFRDAPFLKEINQLVKLKIPETLVKRMLVNYHILKAEQNLKKLRYNEKDSSVSFIRNSYRYIQATDADIYSLSKFYTYYSEHDWALEIIEPRIGKTDVSEDLVFYYLNLMFFHPSSFDTDEFSKALLNASILNTKRFCRFFNPSDKGGASMQLLDHDIIKNRYCEICR